MVEKRMYLLLTNTGSFLTKCIKLYTKKPYNHASIAFDSQLSEVYSFGRKTVRNPFIGGFVKENVKAGLFKHADCVIYSITVSEGQIQKMNQVLKEFVLQKKDYRYNFLGLFGVMFNKPIKRKNAFFCSQFVAFLLKESNIIDFDKPLSLITPHDLQNTSRFQFVYEGKLKDYISEDKAEFPFHFVSV
ncbi:hypothetical protein F4694_003694 [Bacillus niacini]|jgi:hypothetical protein|uniref:Uncharacterized protein n=1 Tax=Neobacillus niacini TaxID=86668 RepID=A0A852TIH1_9BACI|nr:hypothetical protein [Neobacillus niacini]NYE06914.1 hypothetical protein [Neobacillus niacini]